jgi:DNA-binding CsgD family transcriptional regulator
MDSDGLLERGRELVELDSWIERAAGGQGGLVVVEGPAGIGKSRLLAEARSRAAGPMRVLSARGSELEREFPFGVVRQLFEAELAAPERRADLLAGAAAPAAAVFGALDAAPDGSADGASFAALHGLYWLTLNLAEEHPLTLAVDDLHWCDRPSLLFLSYLCRRLDGQPVMVLTGLREAEPGADAALLGEIADDPAAGSIQPAPLSDAAVAAFVEKRLGDAPDAVFATACRDATGGNPLLLTQLVSALRAQAVRPDAAHAGVVRDIGPRAVSRTVLARLARLPDEAGPVARAVAVLGDGAALPTVAALADLELERAAATTRALAQAEILRPEPPLGFVHPLVRDAVYHELPPGERELEHARAADLLRAAGAPTEQVAAQLLYSAPPGERWATDLLWEAGRAAMRKGAADSAAAYLRRALEEAPADGDRARLLFELGAAEALTSGPTAAEHLALAHAALTDPASRAAAAGLLARAQLFMGNPEEGAATARRAAAELPPELDDVRMAFEGFEYMTMYFSAGDPGGLARLREHRQLPEGGPGARSLASMAAWQAVCSDGNADDCAELALAALEGGVLMDADPVLTPFGAIVTLIVTDRPELSDVWSRAIAQAHRHGSLFSISSIHLWLGFSHTRRGDLAAAEESLRAAYSEYRSWGFGEYAITLISCLLTDVLRERGRLDEAASLFAPIGGEPPGLNSTGWWLSARSALLTATGRAEEAAVAADELRVYCDRMPDAGRLWWRSLKAEALDRLDRRDEALAVARDELEVTRAFGAPWCLGRTLRVLGTIERDDGIANLREAVAVLEGSTARLEHAKALAALGVALRRARKPTEAREPLRRALELAGVCGAEGLAEQVRSELYATGSRPRREALSGVESLTPSERRVVDLAAAGRSNREIAQELYVTPKTVEVHLSNAYRKLGIGSRRELAGVLAEPAAAAANP